MKDVILSIITYLIASCNYGDNNAITLYFSIITTYDGTQFYPFSSNSLHTVIFIQSGNAHYEVLLLGNYNILQVNGDYS